MNTTWTSDLASEPLVLTAEDHAFWQKNGYLVVPDAVPVELCEAVKADILKYLGIDAAVPLNDYYDKVMVQDRGGFVNMSQSQALWDTRQSPRLYKVLAEIHGTSKLCVGTDSCHMKLPYREVIDADGTVHTWGNGGVYFGADDPRNNGGGLHWDVHGGGMHSAKTMAGKQRCEQTGGLWAGAGLPSMLEYGDGYSCAPQGVLYLNDRDSNGGGFRCVPGFHRRFDEWLATVPKDRSLEQEDRGHLIATHPELAGLFAEAQTIPAKAGSIVIWHRLLPHSNGRNLSDTPRFAQYICMGPAPTDPDQLRKRRAWIQDVFQRGERRRVPLSDDAHEARWQRWEQSAPPAQLTELGNRLVGLVPWE